MVRRLMQAIHNLKVVAAADESVGLSQTVLSGISPRTSTLVVFAAPPGAAIYRLADNLA